MAVLDNFKSLELSETGSKMKKTENIALPTNLPQGSVSNYDRAKLVSLAKEHIRMKKEMKKNN